MPEYCIHCGAPVSGAFCVKCGERVRPSNAPTQPQPASQSAPSQPQAAPAQPASAAKQAAPAKRSHWGRVLVITGCVLLLFFGMAVAAVLYGVHWVKNKVSGLTGGDSSVTKVERGNSCSLLSKEELRQVLGVAIEKTSEIVEGSEPGCAYYSNPTAFSQLQKMAMEQAQRDSEVAAKRPQPKTDNPMELLKDPNQLESVVKGFGLSQPDKEGRVFAFTVQRDFGRSNWTTIRATVSVVPGFEDLPDVGDRAMMGSMGHALFVLKGDSLISLELNYIPDARTRGAEIGRRIAAHL